MKTEAAETTQTFVSNATALTEGKITKTSIVGGNAAKCKVSDIVLVADGNIYKISAIDETNITLVLPALASYATAASLPENMALYGDLAATDEEFTSGGSSGGGSEINLIKATITSREGNHASFTLDNDIDINKINILFIDDQYIVINRTYTNSNGNSGYFTYIAHEGSLITGNISGRHGYISVSYDWIPQYFSHFIILSSNTLGQINFNYYDTRKEPHTIDTLKAALKGRTVSCSGYIDNSGTKEIATYIEGTSNGSLSVGWFNISDGSMGGTTLDNTITISDTVKPVE